MTRYEQGFMNKCAEYGVDGRDVIAILEKKAALGGGKAVGKLLARLKNWFTPTTLEHIPGEVYKGLNWGEYGGQTIRKGVDSVRELKKVRWDRILAALGVPVAGGAAAYALSGGDNAAAPAPVPEAPAGGAGRISTGKLLALLGGGAAAAGAGVAAGHALTGRGRKELEDEDSDKKRKRIKS